MVKKIGLFLAGVLIAIILLLGGGKVDSNGVAPQQGSEPNYAQTVAAWQHK